MSTGRGARYLLRFDDLCPTMDWATWNRLEPLLVDHGVRPILAVIPDNRDPRLVFGPPAPDFWDRVRGWQARGWAIGLHGYQHLYVTREPGLLGFPTRSEFAGLDRGEQLRKLRLAVEIFQREGVRPDVWVAPAHAFDWTTVSALMEVGIRTISDGAALRPYRDPHGNIWIPQQVGRMRPLPLGTWTFCYHLDDFEGRELLAFTRRLAQLAPRMISLEEARAQGDRTSTLADGLILLSKRALMVARKARAAWNR